MKTRNRTIFETNAVLKSPQPSPIALFKNTLANGEITALAKGSRKFILEAGKHRLFPFIASLEFLLHNHLDQLRKPF